MDNSEITRLKAEMRIMGQNIDNLRSRIISKSGHIISLDLKNVDLSSFPYFPRSIVKMFQLEHLSMENSNLIIVPSELLGLKNLKKLNLSRNSIQEIPQWFSQIKSLKYLILSNNRIENVNALPKTVEVLNLSENNLDEIPTCIRQLMKLKVLNLAKNYIRSITDVLPGSLEVLNLRSNYLRQIPPFVFHQNMLRKLNIYDNPISHFSPDIENTSIKVFIDKRIRNRQKSNIITLNPVLYDVRNSLKYPPSFQLTSVMIFGSENTGKKTILNKYINNHYFPSNSLAVIQNRYLAWEHYILDQKGELFQFWYPQMQDKNNDYYVQGILSGFYYTSIVTLVFDLTDIDSFRLILNSIGRIHEIRHQSCPVIVVGNKSDKIERFGSFSSIKNTLETLGRNLNIGLNYIEVSAKTGFHIKELFELIYEQQI